MEDPGKTDIRKDKRTIKTAGVGIALSLAVCLFILLFAIREGSVYISIPDLLKIIGSHITGKPLPPEVDPMADSIFWTIRTPRAITAFLVGGCLSVSGAVMQAVLQNPLASSYTLGVSSGASLGAGFVLLCGITVPWLAGFMLPAAGFVFGLATVAIAILLASRIDRNVSNQTIVLIGMILSLFVTGIMNFMMTFYGDKSKQLWLWMTGSFSARNWTHCAILTAVGAFGFVSMMMLSGRLDILTFGELQASSMGVEVKKTKILAILISSLLTGVSVAFAGVIGFIDLAAPHVVRRIFGPSHKIVIPMSFIYGGAFMALCDLAARTVLSPREIPVGAVTALVGAPFFAYVFFTKGRRAA
ncbi:MAG: iron ABC transporter permease [Clostridiales bacterium]|nr:iron ABC transporter permease [Clostridiales bacterium]